MFFIDALRHAGRAQLASFAGGAEGNREMDRASGPTRRIAATPSSRSSTTSPTRPTAPPGTQIQADVDNYVAGINARIAELRANPLLMPGEYPLLGHPERARDWKVTDVISIASLVAGIFGKGGGNEVDSALVLEAARKRFGKRAGKRVWADFRRANDPEAPTTIHGQALPLHAGAAGPPKAALPDPGTIGRAERRRLVDRERRDRSRGSGALPDVGALLNAVASMQGASNALLVSRPESKGGAPIAVFGPQVSYYTPQILIEQEIHAPGGTDRSAARRPRHRLPRAPTSSSSSATAATTPGRRPRRPGHHRHLRGRALQRRRLEADARLDELRVPGPRACRSTCSSGPTRGRQSPATRRPRARRPTARSAPRSASSPTAPRSAASPTRSRSCARPTTTRSTRRSGSPTSTTPRRWSRRQEFMQAACRIQYTFNWFFIDSKQIAYFNSGINPVRAKRAHPDLPTPGTRKFEWQGFVAAEPGAALGRPGRPDQRRPADQLSAQEPCAAHPQVVDQRYITSWNNKQAPGFRAPDDDFSTRSGVPLDPPRRPDRAADRAARKRITPAEARRRDGGRRHRRPARRRGAPATRSS